jgi:methylglutaconyl-CoA hydratase
MVDEVLTTVDNRGVATLTLNRPAKHNAFDDTLIQTLTRQLEALDNDSNIRIVVLTGAGPSFSSGADLGWMQSMVNYSEEANRQDALRLAGLMETLNTLAKPTVARVNGAAFGGALGLIACCDIAVATEDCQFAFSEVKLGIVPAVISPYIIAAIGPRWARKLFLTGEVFNATLARKTGLVHEVVAADKLDGAVNRQIHLLLKGGPAAQHTIKKLIQTLVDNDSHISQYTADIIAEVRTSPEGQEGLHAFLEKRKPVWSNNK